MWNESAVSLHVIYVPCSAYIFVRCLCPLTPPEKVSYEGHGELCISSLQRLAYHGCEYLLLKGNNNYPLYYFFFYIIKLLSFSYLAGRPVLIVKDPVHLPSQLPHHNASKIMPLQWGPRTMYSPNQKKKWKILFPHLKYILITNKILCKLYLPLLSVYWLWTS